MYSELVLYKSSRILYYISRGRRAAPAGRPRARSSRPRDGPAPGGAAPVLLARGEVTAGRQRSLNVLELGAGCGLAGITAAHLGASLVAFTDHDPGTLELIIQSLALQSFHDGDSAAATEQLSSGSVSPKTWCLDLSWGESGTGSEPTELQGMHQVREGKMKRTKAPR